MKATLQRIIIFAEIIQVFGAHAWAATINLPSAISLPNPAQSSQSGQKGEEQLKKLNLPNEIPIQMMKFPPLQSMHFDMIPSFQKVPVSKIQR